MTAQEVKAIEAASRAARAAREEWAAMQAEIERLRADVARLQNELASVWQRAWKAERANEQKAADPDACADCGRPRKDHDYNGACYGLCGKFRSVMGTKSET